MTIAFPEELTVGIAEIDAQHRAFYESVNRLHDAMRVHDLAEVYRLGDYLVEYARDHFATEERHMIEAGYPGFPEHLAQHAGFVRDLQAWRARLTAEGPTATVAVELSAWLTRWLGEHIRRLDAEMARFLRARVPPGRPPAR